MITHIDIDKFGSFQNFVWPDSIEGKAANTTYFKRLNILYGRNYAGKTTLSRIFRSLETGALPSKYAKPKFTLHGDRGHVDEGLSTQGSAADRHYDIWVYNSDFVQDNLSFLVSEVGGDIKAFAIVGAENKKIALEIAEIDAKLGSIKDNAGLYYRQDEKKIDRNRCAESHRVASASLEDKLRLHANNKIKVNRDYGSALYNISRIREDIAEVKRLGMKPLTIDAATKKHQLLKQVAMRSIDQSVEINLKLGLINLVAQALLSKSIQPTQAIQELLNDATLQAWVKQGMPLHKEKRDTCAFCLQDLPREIWETLGAHFNQESSDMESSLVECIELIDAEIKDVVHNSLTFDAELFYADLRPSFEAQRFSLATSLERYEQDLAQLRRKLDLRRNSLFHPVSMPVSEHDPDLIQQCVENINELLKKHNSRNDSLPADRESARNQLRLSDVASLIDTIQYDAELTRIEKLESATNAAKDAYEAVTLEIKRMEDNRVNLESRQQDESLGARAVNVLLNNFFGHDGLELVVRDDKAKTAVKFEVMRGEQPAFNLSEGERSLIAFCYFMAKLQESMRLSSDQIIYIDDPISSLDGNHIFFVFSLIDTLIASPVKEENGSKSYRYKQLFISTHNLEFLKYLKRLPFPKTRENSERGQKKDASDLAYFLLERNRTGSKLRLMPRYLREYITEFQYLFHQIYKCRCASDDDKDNEAFYGFGNNLRKFLEIFLFFQYPHLGDQDEKQERLRKYLGPKNSHAVTLIWRLVNEFSHLESEPDRSLKPIDVPEMAKVASLILDRMKEKDVEQYESLLLSVGESLVPVTKS